MPNNQTAPRVALDWSRLFIFDQARPTEVDAEAAARLTDPRLAKIGFTKPKQGFRLRA